LQSFFSVNICDKLNILSLAISKILISVFFCFPNSHPNRKDTNIQFLKHINDNEPQKYFSAMISIVWRAYLFQTYVSIQLSLDMVFQRLLFTTNLSFL